MAHRTCGWQLVPASLGLALLLATSTATAQTSMAVLGIEAVDAPEELAGKLSEALKLRVQRSPDYLLQGGKGLDEIKLVFGCMEEAPACMAKAGKSLQVQKMLWGSLWRVPTGYNLTLKLLDVDAARVEKFSSEHYGPGQLEGAEADEVIKKATASILASKTGALRVTSSVPGARVLVDGQAVGLSDPEGLLVEDLEPGLHQVKVERAGYEAFTGQVAILSGQTVSLSARLEPLAETPVAPLPDPIREPAEETTSSNRTAWQVAFWSGLAVSLGLAAAAVTTGVQSWGYEEDLENLLAGTDLADRQALFAASSKTSDANYQSLLRGEIPDACNPPGGLSASGQLQDLCDKGESRATLSTGLWIAAGGVAALTTVFGYLAFRGQERPAEREVREPEASRWQLAPAIAPQAASLSFSLRF